MAECDACGYGLRIPLLLSRLALQSDSKVLEADADTDA